MEFDENEREVQAFEKPREIEEPKATTGERLGMVFLTLHSIVLGGVLFWVVLHFVLKYW
jgi:hypothetical protein